MAHTLASNDFHTHAGVLMPGQRVKLDKPRHYRCIQVDVMCWIWVCVAGEHLPLNNAAHVLTHLI